jgi:Flp pilus assembly protein TadD
MMKIWAVLGFVLLVTVLVVSALGQTTAQDWIDKGVAFAVYGNLDEAIRAFDRAIEINSQNVDAWHNKGVTLKLLGRTTEADAAFAKVKELENKG